MSEIISRDEIEGALRGHDADYVEVRIDDTATNRITYRGRELEEIGRTRSFGGNVRALVKGGWGFVSFNDPTGPSTGLRAGLWERVAEAVSQARHVGLERSMLAEVAPVVDSVPLEVKKDPRPIPLSRKKELLDRYNEAMWSVPGVASTNIIYWDGHKRVTFASSEGSYIEQERIDVVSRLAATARRDGDVQQASLSLGALNDFSYVERLEEEARRLARRAVELLSTPYVKAGTYPVVLDPVLAGVFCHEAFGHLSESDFVYENERMKEIMVLGRRFGQPHLNIVDGAATPGLRGSFKYDDEGVPAQRTDLIREGILVGRLHSRETAGKMGEGTTGNARAIDYRFPPIVRMTNTYIERGETAFDDLIADIKEGVYAKNWFGGTTSMEMFTFSAGEAYMIRNGKIVEAVRPVKLTGNLFTTLMNIDGLGNDMAFNQGGGCGKGGQMPLPVSNGSPHIRIQDCVVGER